MKRLSALDALFLYLETPETPMHVASLTIFRPETPSHDLFGRFRAHTEARLDRLPSYRRRLASTPLAIDHPVWVVDDRLDLDRHIRHAALPNPGGMAELRELVAQLHAVPLDRTRPLWEYTFIEGLKDGAFAVYLKVHHAAMDGVAGMATLGTVYDFAPEDERLPQPARGAPDDAGPADAIELTSTAIGDFVRQALRAARALPSIARALTSATPNLTRDAKFLYRYVKDMPRTPFNAAISGNRVYATASLPLAEVKALARSRGVTLNDVVLALTAGALRRYLAVHGALPEKPLTAGVPASLRRFGDARLNNQVIFTLSRLPTDVAEPLPRLAAAKAAGQEAKALFADLRGIVATDVSIVGAPLVIMGLARLWARARAANYVWPFFNVVVSNVPGPMRPMYCVGAPATHYFPISIPFHGGALNVTVQSYLDTLDFGLIACSETVPDAQRIADFAVEEFAALQKADAEFASADIVQRIAEMTPEPLPAPPERKSPLTREIEALGEATDALRRALEARSPGAAAKNSAPASSAAHAAPPAKPKRPRLMSAAAARRRPNPPDQADIESAPPSVERAV